MRVSRRSSRLRQSSRAAPRSAGVPERSALVEDRNRRRGRPSAPDHTDRGMVRLWVRQGPASAGRLSARCRSPTSSWRRASPRRAPPTAPDRDARRSRRNERRSTPSCLAPIFRSAPLPRPLRTAARASRRCEPTTSKAKSRTSLAPSTKSPVPQKSAPSAKPHSAVPKPGSSERTWKRPIAVSEPCGTTAKHDILARGALAKRPRDEALESVDRRRRRRNEARHVVAREHREQRLRVAIAKLTQRDERAGQERQTVAPVGAGGRRGRRHRHRCLVEMRLVRHLFHLEQSPHAEHASRGAIQSPAPEPERCWRTQGA